MSTSTVQGTTTRLATLPRVNLLPPEIAEAQRFRKVQAGLGLGVLAALGVVGALFVGATSQVADAQDELDAQNARSAKLKAQQAQYAEVPVVYAQVEAARAQLAAAMGQEVRYSYFLNDLSLSVPSKVWLTSMTVVQTDTAAPVAGAPVTAAPGSTGYLTPGVGNVTFEGYGLKHNDVAAWLDALARTHSLNQPYFTSSKLEELEGTEVVKFASQATFTEEALSKRWTEKAGS